MKKSNYSKDILAFHHEDDNNDYDSFSKYLTEHTENQKKQAINEIAKTGDYLLDEIERKKQHENKIKRKLIRKIRFRTKKYRYDELYSYSLPDVRDILKELKTNSFINNLFNFLFSNP